MIPKFITKNLQKGHKKGHDMWLDNLKDLKAKTGMSSKQIAEKTNLPERTVIRIPLEHLLTSMPPREPHYD